MQRRVAALRDRSRRFKSDGECGGGVWCQGGAGQPADGVLETVHSILGDGQAGEIGGACVVDGEGFLQITLVGLAAEAGEARRSTALNEVIGINHRAHGLFHVDFRLGDGWHLRLRRGGLIHDRSFVRNRFLHRSGFFGHDNLRGHQRIRMIGLLLLNIG